MLIVLQKAVWGLALIALAVGLFGFATKDIARLLRVPVGTVLARLHRGRKLFERGLWDYAERHGLLAQEALA